LRPGGPLDAARHLAEAGVPLFLARPDGSALGFALPQGWERTETDPGVVDRWKPGWALCAVMGHVVDAVDVDPRNGGSWESLEEALEGHLPEVYGKASTPSGGEHYLVASLGVRKVQDLVPGVDLQAGNGDGAGRGFIFLAPTVRESKETGELRSYGWEVDPDVGMLLLSGDESGRALEELARQRQNSGRGTVDDHGSYEGPPYSELDEDLQREAREYVTDYLDLWSKRFKEVVNWPEGQREEGPKSRGWEGLTYQFVWALAKMAACPWTDFSADDARVSFENILPLEMAEAVPGKWYDGIVEKAESEPVDTPPWVNRTSAEEDFAEAVRSVQELPPCDHTNDSHVTRWLIRQVGQGPLSGLFRRGDEDLIYTPRVGEEGYEPPANPEDWDGPAQVRRMSPLRLASRVDASYRVFRSTKKEVVDMVFKRELAERVMSDLDRCPSLKRVALVSHTPLARADGSVLDDPGYDEASQVLYLPEQGLRVPPVPPEPSVEEVEAARDLILWMLVDFPFVSEHDRANYLGCLLLPLLRNIVPPPYQMLIIGAPQRGSGKSLLAEIIRIVHGGVFRSEIPDGEDERRKVITSILDGTSAPVIQFDNVSGVLKSSTMDGLLTNAVWSDRRLGGNENVIVPNDRLWVVTGNNVMIGGDMDRRVLWSTINANLEHPELRSPTEFEESDLRGWVGDHRSEVLHSMLVLIRAWVAAGRPVREAPTSDSFGTMQQTLRGIMRHAGIGGEVGHQKSKPKRPDLDAEDWSIFLQAVRRVMGDEAWTARELLDTLEGAAFDDDGDCLHPEELPGDLADKVRSAPHSVTKSLGKLLSSRQGQWAAGVKAENAGGGGKNAVKWRVTDEV